MLTKNSVHSSDLIATCRAIVGGRQVLTTGRATRFYRMGFREGGGPALAVIRPASLVELWRVLEACHQADVAVILQASNTGLTGGSTPVASGYDRDVVIISTRRIRGIVPVNGASQVVCLPGATLHQLERLLQPLGREPHSLIGSSCFGASVIGGVCNNSGGSLVHRGVAYTEYALFARTTEDGRLELVNHLGIDLGDDPVAMLQRLDDGRFQRDLPADGNRVAHDTGYQHEVRDVDSATPARHNSDPRCLHEASGSAGKVAVFAVRLDTFPLQPDTRTFYIGSGSPARLEELRRLILTECDPLPIAGEYLHSEAFDLADRYGKDQFLLIEKMGTDRMPRFFAMKGWMDATFSQWTWLPENLVDRVMYRLGNLWPDHLPKRMREWRQRFEHHLLVKVAAADAPMFQAVLDRWKSDDDDYFLCTPKEAAKAFLHRFVVAGAAVRYHALHSRDTGGVLSLDVALRRNDRAWFEQLPPDIASRILHRIYYGHFLCHVLHQDYVLVNGADAAAVKEAMLQTLDQRGAIYPAEHNVGHSYRAPPELAAFYRATDPENMFNPGIGKTSQHRKYAVHE